MVVKIWTNYKDQPAEVTPKGGLAKESGPQKGRNIQVKDLLGGGFKYFLFSPLLGDVSHFDDHIFQMGWFNHQLDLYEIAQKDHPKDFSMVERTILQGCDSPERCHALRFSLRSLRGRVASTPHTGVAEG